ncbi:phosphonate C-P lyase system protein PhnG [Paracoccus sp. S-4012]|uniref:phosphonate C-P lyase system protein PhnG n=1 Tax=Paracoccus sp. S-4012 TaxID=2665648 RepID=UPI0012B0A9C0|nr:phosphonate C-P lyase system protein PhnG [Paracoccus sp. S-4012]MRX52114.1 phosphonate C-P lyase system protein PhnG [Paracoccus sp. S-4012]
MTRSRSDSLGLLARADAARVAALMPDLPALQALRAPEIGTVMVRGRAGGTGAAFNLGEMTVTRASVQLDCGAVGHGYVQGRSKDHALRAAAVDALLQTSAADRIEAKVLAPLAAEEKARRTALAARAAATKVEFFTLVRGEDE